MTQTVADTLAKHITATASIREPDGKWHPSSLFACSRQAVYEFLGTAASDEKDARTKRILSQGTRLHEFVQAAYTNESGALGVYHEVEIARPSGVYGHCDTLLQIGPDEWELLEFKSISPDGLRWGKKKGDLLKDEHVKQAQTYADTLTRYGGAWHEPSCNRRDGKCLGGGPDYDPSVFPVPICVYIPPLGDSLKRIRIAYFDRNDLTIEEFVSERADPFNGDFEFPTIVFAEWLDALVGELGSGHLPRRLVARQGDHWLCAKYCQYRTLCWKGDTQ